jgi:hypothetical protein
MKVDVDSYQWSQSVSKMRSPAGGAAGDSNFMQEAEKAIFALEARQSGFGYSKEEGDSKLSYKELLLKRARESDAVAEELLGYNIDEGVVFNSGLIDISRDPIITYSVSGELVTDESKAYYTAVSKYAVTSRLNILRAGRDAGTPAAEILEKIIDFDSALPKRYKDMANISF